MPTFIRALLIALLLCFAVALSSRHAYFLKDSHEVAIAWSREGSAHQELLLTLQIEPKQSQLDEQSLKCISMKVGQCAYSL